MSTLPDPQAATTPPSPTAAPTSPAGDPDAGAPSEAVAPSEASEQPLHYDRPGVENMVEVRDVHLAFGEKQILKGISFLVERGETLVVMGASGVGKSTVLRLVLGILKPGAGSIVVVDTDMSIATGEQLTSVRDRIGMVFQGGALFDSLTVGENVGFRLREKGQLNDEEIAEEVREKLSFVDLEPEVADLMPAELSGGMRKRVAIARALVGEPDIILFDEPTTGLDPITAETIDQLMIKARKARQAATMIVTHDLDSAFAAGTRFGMLHDGRIIFDGTKDEFLASPNPYIQEFIHLRKSTL